MRAARRADGRWLGLVLGILASAVGLTACSSGDVSELDDANEEAASALAAASPSWNGYRAIHFGVRCQDTFQNGWAANIPTLGLCNNFINTLESKGNVKDFYFNLHGAHVAFNNSRGEETCLGCGGVDSTDLFFVSTHGTTNGRYVGFTMWDKDWFAWSLRFRFGDNGKQAKIFASYACDTIRVSEGSVLDRWLSAFSGGLQIALGAHELLWVPNDGVGTEFANRMNDGKTIANAWLEATWYTDNKNRPAVVTTGVDASDCWSRQGMDLSSVQHLPRLRDGAIGHMCWSWWN